MVTGVHPSEQATQRVILRHVSWETYERLLAEHEQCSSPRFTYDCGVLEIMSPSTKHERWNRSIGVPEVWRYDGIRVAIFKLAGGAYQEQETSEAFPGVTSQIITRFMEESKTLQRTVWIRRVRAWARHQSGA